MQFDLTIGNQGPMTKSMTEQEIDEEVKRTMDNPAARKVSTMIESDKPKKENDGAMRAAQELSVSPCATVFDLDAAAAIIRRETNQWIPCDKRMPTKGDADENNMVYWWNGKIKWVGHFTYGTILQDNKEHQWRPLPTPPEKS